MRINVNSRLDSQDRFGRLGPAGIVRDSVRLLNGNCLVGSWTQLLHSVGTFVESFEFEYSLQGVVS